MAVGSAPDVVVIGAGAIGCSAAYYLARAGVRVEVLDRGEIGREASWASAGMLGSSAVGGDDPLSTFYRKGAALFPEFAARIRDETGIDIGYWRCGSLRLCRDTVAWSGRESEFRTRAAAGAEVECWTGEMVRSRVPALAPDTVGALYFPGAGQVRPPRFVRALAVGAARLGARLRP